MALLAALACAPISGAHQGEPLAEPRDARNHAHGRDRHVPVAEAHRARVGEPLQRLTRDAGEQVDVEGTADDRTGPGERWLGADYLVLHWWLPGQAL